jgi:hypothetical protein
MRDVVFPVGSTLRPKAFARCGFIDTMALASPNAQVVDSQSQTLASCLEKVREWGTGVQLDWVEVS